LHGHETFDRGRNALTGPAVEHEERSEVAKEAPARPRVLVVDDEDDIRVLLEQELGSAGFEVIAAVDGLHALRLALAGRPDVLIVDLALPLMSGAEFLTRWRKRTGRDDAPVVVISAHADLIEAARDVRPDAVFRKPFDVHALVAAVTEYARR